MRVKKTVLQKREVMKKIGVLLLCVIWAGCVTIEESPLKSLTRIQQVREGLSKEEVRGILGDEVVVGYEITDVKEGRTKALTVKNPQRTETVRRGDETYEVLFYFTHIRQADGVITDDELTPLVFHRDRLIGKGWRFLKKIRKR